MKEVLKRAINTYGVDMQLNVAIEELSELIKELCKYKRGDGSDMHIAEEMAGVKIILEELEIIFDNKYRIEAWYKTKIQRLKDRMRKER